MANLTGISNYDYSLEKIFNEAEDFLPLLGTDYVELYVGNAKQAAYYYKTAFGFQSLAYAGLETGVRDRTSYVLQQGKILLPVGTAKGSFIDARDIAAVAARLLTSDEFSNRDFDLTGPVALDHDAVAAILSRETGRAIAFQDIPPAAMLDGLLTAGLPRPYAEILLLILGFFKAGYSEHTTDAVAQILGRAPGSFEQYAKDYRAALAA